MILAEDEPVAMVSRSIDTVKEHVDGMYITVTYRDVKPETSPLLDLLKEYGAQVSFFQWVDDFSAARQFAMDQAPHGPDQYIYWQDADDVLANPEYLRPVFNDAFQMGWAAVFLNYWYRVSIDEEKGDIKDILIEHKRERIVRNDGTFRWKGMLHETLIDQRNENVTKYLRKELWVVHLTTEDRVDVSLPRNIRILEKQAALESHKDPRTLVYLAKGYFDLGVMDAAKRAEWHQKALTLFGEYLEGIGKPGDPNYQEGSGWAQERANAWQFVHEIYKFAGDLPQALRAISQAIEEAPDFPIFYIEKAMVYTHMEDYKKAKTLLTLATGIDMPETTIIQTPRDLKMKALEVDCRIAEHEQDMKRLVQNLKEMIRTVPESEFLRERLKVATSLEAANRAAQCVVYLGKYLEKINEEDKVQALLEAVPNDLRAERFYSEMKHKHIPPRIHEANEISILCGPGFEQWSPQTVEKGIGGSEEAVIYLSKELAKLGWKVTVYANPQHEKGEYDGVTYLPYYELNLQDVFNVLILWRSIGFTDFKPKAKYTMVWMHDMPNNPDFTEARLSRVDSIAVLSEFHKKQFRMLKDDGTFVEIPASAFFMTRNGITDMSKYTWKGDPHKLIYSSSPDRGLIYLLTNWDKIREEVPDATLEIYYGFDVFDALFHDNPGRMKWKEAMLRLMDKPGITYHGRVSHAKLHEAMTKAGIWAYPSHFEEISCITGMKAQALGAVPVVTDYAALTETVKNGLKVDVDIEDKEGQAEYITALIGLMKDEAKQKEFRKAMMPWARSYFGWDKVAKQWSDKFGGAKPTEVLKSPLLTPEQFVRATEGLSKGK